METLVTTPRLNVGKILKVMQKRESRIRDISMYDSRYQALPHLSTTATDVPDSNYRGQANTQNGLRPTPLA